MRRQRSSSSQIGKILTCGPVLLRVADSRKILLRPIPGAAWRVPIHYPLGTGHAGVVFRLRCFAGRRLVDRRGRNSAEGRGMDQRWRNTCKSQAIRPEELMGKGLLDRQ